MNKTETTTAMLEKIFYKYNGLFFSTSEKAEGEVMRVHPELLDDQLSDYCDMFIEECTVDEMRAS